jgi:hypothetical protein
LPKIIAMKVSREAVLGGKNSEKISNFSNQTVPEKMALMTFYPRKEQQ